MIRRIAANETGGTSRTPSFRNSQTVLQIRQVRIQTKTTRFTRGALIQARSALGGETEHAVDVRVLKASTKARTVSRTSGALPWSAAACEGEIVHMPSCYIARMQRFLFAVSFAALTAALPTVAQQRTITADDYARAERFMSYNTTPLVLRSGVRPNWLDDGRFWYRVTTEKGSEAFLVDPVKRTKAAVRSAAMQRRPGRRSRRGSARGNGAGTWRRRAAQRYSLAGRQTHGIRARTQPVGARCRKRQGNPAHDRRRQGLWLRDQQRGMDEERPADPAVVARFEADRHLPTRRHGKSARCISSTRASAIRSCRRGNIRCRETSTSSCCTGW